VGNYVTETRMAYVQYMTQGMPLEHFSSLYSFSRFLTTLSSLQSQKCIHLRYQSKLVYFQLLNVCVCNAELFGVGRIPGVRNECVDREKDGETKHGSEKTSNAE
jgi:hypothetical protein